MEIVVLEAARSYIAAKSRDKAITIRHEATKTVAWVGPCGPPARYPSVRLGIPNVTDGYEQINVNGITVYYQFELAEVYSVIEVGIEKIFFIKVLVAKGTRK